MRRFNIAYTVGSIALAAFSLQSCVSRTENLDNLNVITKPYSLYFADTLGLVYTTYNGERFDVLNSTQGVSVDALGTTGEFILMKMVNGTILFVDDGGQGNRHNFNPSYKNVNPAAFGPSVVLNLPKYNDTGAIKRDRVYVASSINKGIAYSDNNANYDSSWFHPGDVELGSSVTSFAKLDNGTIVAFDDVSRGLWVKANLTSEWKSKPATGIAAAATGQMYIISQKNDILAVMINGAGTDYGIWRSTDGGNTFSKLPDINPSDPVKDITCAAAPFGKVLIACTRANGIWRLSGQGTWERASVGLKNNIRVYAISAKSNKFKNDKTGEYVFIATSDGLYRSDDLGQTWVRLEVPGSAPVFTAMY